MGALGKGAGARLVQSADVYIDPVKMFASHEMLLSQPGDSARLPRLADLENDFRERPKRAYAVTAWEANPEAAKNRSGKGRNIQGTYSAPFTKVSFTMAGSMSIPSSRRE